MTRGGARSPGGWQAWTVVLVALAGPFGSGCAPTPAKQVQEVPVQNHVPFEIRLKALKGPGLAAWLINRAPTPLPVLHDLRLQASRLVLRGADGVEVEPFDRRALMKFDPRVYCNLFRPLAPGGDLKLAEIRFEKEDDAWTLTWGPYAFEELTAGSYTARISWTSAAADCQDDAEAEPHPVPGVWLGTVTSNEVTVVLK